MRDHFGFGNRNNLMLTALHGFFYMFSAWNAGRFAQKLGHFFSPAAGILRHGLGDGAGRPDAEIFGLLSHSACSRNSQCSSCGPLSMCLTWPTLAGVLKPSRNAHQDCPRTAGIYNMIWASGAAVAYLTGGALLEKFGGETLVLAAGRSASDPAPYPAPTA